MSLVTRLQELLGRPGAHVSPGPLDEFVDENAPTATIEEPIQVAGIGTGLKAVREALEPLFKKGAKPAALAP
jgi:hypothetical protein